MRRYNIAESSFSWFCSLLIVAGVGSIMSYGQGRCSSSCGNLHNIKYPFRLRGDPPDCGSPDFEFNCTEANYPLFEIKSNRYYVTDISYYHLQITLLDVGLARGNCSLPAGSLSVSYIDSRDLSPYNILPYNEVGQATFFNCSEKIYNDTSYELLPCLSNNSSSIYVLVEHDSNQIARLPSNCSFISTVPVSVDSHTDLRGFELFRQGFRLTWTPPIRSAAEAIHECFRTTKLFILRRYAPEEGFKEQTVNKLNKILQFELKFLSCLREKHFSHSRITYISAAALLLLLHITVVILVLLMIGRFLLAPLCLISFLAYNLLNLLVPIDRVEKFLQNQESFSTSRYSYNDIITMTCNFKEELGKGGFGSVFKGKLPGGYLVAVKMLGRSMGDGEDFINEVSTIGRIHHVNVVQLVGFCAEGSYRALVYEYMANGSLDKYIFTSTNKKRFFTNEKLNEIALSVAKGLNYLHQGCNMRILHFDIKPHNILLDHNFTTKISDFGLAKLQPKGYSLVSMSAARGTIGYIAPELVSRSFGPVSHKSDVYSFGMLLMDMAGGRRHADMKAENSSQVYYPSWIYDKLQHMEEHEIFETIEIDDLERKLCKVGLWCIQTRPADRPSMSKVVEMLDAEIDTLQMPPKPFFSISEPISAITFSADSYESELPMIPEN